jgi:hypothetical protein
LLVALLFGDLILLIKEGFSTYSLIDFHIM